MLLLSKLLFKSKTAKQRHESVFHRRQKTISANTYDFKCNVCNESFTSLSSLNRHKKAKQHTKRENPAPIRPSTKKTKKRQRTINAMLREQKEVESSSSEDEEGLCAATNCTVNNNRNNTGTIAWISCDICVRWFHNDCVLVGAAHTESQLEHIAFVFDCCSHQQGN